MSTAQLWQCNGESGCLKTYWSPIAVGQVTCPGPHSPGGSRVMHLVLEGEAAEAVSPYRDEPVTTVRRGRTGG